MRSTFGLSIFLLLFSTLVCRAEKRIALVVGNSNYQSISPLANPRNDAALIAETLRKVGFILVGGRAQIDLDKPAFDRAIQAFGNELTGADVALFYYAGHGVQVRNVNYLVPTSANPVKEADVDFQMVDVNLVLRQMEGSGTKLNLVILDACRNNPFGGRGLRGTESGLAQLRAPEGTLLSYATQPCNVALDGTGSNSPYTSALAQAIQKPGLDIFQTFNQVGLQVKRATGGSQQPWVSSSPIDGSFYFASTTPNQPVAAPPQTVMAPSAPPRPVAIDPALEQRATAFVIEDMKQSQGSTAEFLNYARSSLDERIDYYGKSTSRDDVLKDKERYVKNWPNRSYRLQMDTIRTSCDQSRSVCQISGALEFSHSNPSNGKKSAGTASFEYGIRFGPDGGKLFYEQGKTLSAQR
ncbi:MAG: caspase family protein [Bradyrhizobium sp.]|nr:caspase family protein [Bradyrhizobium sp.]